MEHQGRGNDPQRPEDQEQFGCKDRIGNEHAIGDAREHLRASQRHEHRVSIETEAHCPAVAAVWMPATMLAAPNRMKQPRMTVAPCRQLIRPVSIRKPTDATAITAATVATVPNKVPCSQLTADTITPEPAGSE